MPDVIVLGADGYTGWPLVCRLLDHGYNVHGVDHLGARDYRGQSVTPIAEHELRADVATDVFNGQYSYDTGLDITRYRHLRASIDRHEPDYIVNLAQIPSAPYSMRGIDEAWRTQHNNIQGALNLLWALHETDTDAHVVQLATMGEYGTPDTQIPEGFLPDGRPAPKAPGSLYHASKVAMTVNTRFLSETWDIPVTEIYQGIVYGLSTDATDGHPALQTRFDVDPTWGTVLNRFTAQAAIDHPLTVYGKGGQKRAMLSLQDCVRCLQLCMEHPPAGDALGRNPYRAVNQFDGSYRVQELAEMIQAHTGARIRHLDNPRAEDDSAHHYDPQREVLDELGYEPRRDIETEFQRTHDIVEQHAGRIDGSLRPTTEWT